MISQRLIKNILLIVAMILVFGLHTGCSFTIFSFSVPPDPPCPIKNLLLEVSFFPGTDWEETGLRTARGAPSTLGIGRIGTTFSTPTKGGAIQHIYRFWDSKEAGKGYEELTKTWVSPEDGYTEWMTPSELINLPINADQSLLACHVHITSQVERCQYIAQYESYVVEFRADLIALSYKDFIELVREIDRRATSCLRQ